MQSFWKECRAAMLLQGLTVNDSTEPYFKTELLYWPAYKNRICSYFLNLKMGREVYPPYNHTQSSAHSVWIFSGESKIMKVELFYIQISMVYVSSHMKPNLFSFCIQYYHMNLRERCKVFPLVNRYLLEGSLLALMRPSTALQSLNGYPQNGKI